MTKKTDTWVEKVENMCVFIIDVYEYHLHPYKIHIEYTAESSEFCV